MKRIFIILAFLFCIISPLFSQDKSYKVVFDMTTKDTNVHKAVIRWCNLITQANPDAQLEIVYYGQSLDMIVNNRSVVSSDLVKLASGKNVSFKVCEMAMQHHKIDKSMLLTGVSTVPDGIYEIVLKQKEGYAYIKAGL